MPAMEMTFSVNPRALTKGVRPGDQVEFNVEGKTYTIVGLKVVGHTLDRRGRVRLSTSK
jgi:Cu/Ag efflux protein CusF